MEILQTRAKIAQKYKDAWKGFHQPWIIENFYKISIGYTQFVFLVDIKIGVC
jgi:hypothetical protein